MFICSRKGFSDDNRDKNGSYISPHSTAKRSKKSRTFSRLIGKKDSSKRNPYAERGLDKFYTLLADLDDKKQKIYSQIGVEDVSLVRFVFSDSSKHVRPIVVMVKNKNSELNSSAAEEEMDDRSKEKGIAEEKKEEVMKMCERWNEGLSSSFGVVMALVLLFLAIYGRPLAIFCTTITWYLAMWKVSERKKFDGKVGIGNAN